MTVRHRAHDRADGEAVEVIVNEDEDTQHKGGKGRAHLCLDVLRGPAAKGGGAAGSVHQCYDDAQQHQKQENAGVVGNCGYQAIVDDHIQRSDGGKALCEQRPHHNTDKEGAVGLLGNKRQRDSDHRRQQRPDRTVQAAGSGLLTGSQHRDAQQSGGQCGQQRCAQDRMLLHGISPFVFRFQYGGA